MSGNLSIEKQISMKELLLESITELNEEYLKLSEEIEDHYALWRKIRFEERKKELK